MTTRGEGKQNKITQAKKHSQKAKRHRRTQENKKKDTKKETEGQEGKKQKHMETG